MEDKSQKETELKQSLMQKDKEQLAELYLQMKWEQYYLREENQIYSQKVKDLKQDNGEHKEYLKALEYDLECFKNRGLTAGAVVNILKENDGLKQQLKEKDHAIEKLKNLILTTRSWLCRILMNRTQPIKNTTKRECYEVLENLQNLYKTPNLLSHNEFLEQFEEGENSNAEKSNN